MCGMTGFLSSIARIAPATDPKPAAHASPSMNHIHQSTMLEQKCTFLRALLRSSGAHLLQMSCSKASPASLASVGRMSPSKPFCSLGASAQAPTAALDRHVLDECIRPYFSFRNQSRGIPLQFSDSMEENQSMLSFCVHQHMLRLCRVSQC